MEQNHPPVQRAKRSYIAYLTVRICTTFTYQMISVAIGWQIYSLTHSAFDLGLAGLVQFAPLLLFMLVVGIAADHFNRKLIIVLSLIVTAIGYLMLAVSTYSHWITREWIFAVVFLIGTAGAFQGTAMQAVLPNIVSKDEFPKAAAGASSVSQIATIIGPALGGILYAMDPVVVYVLSAALTVMSVGAILMVHMLRQQSTREPITLRTILMGFSFMRNRPVILGAISFDLFAVLFGGATALLPVYAASILHIGSFGLGFLRSAPAIGALIISFMLSRRPVTNRVGHVLFIAVTIFGVATIVFALSRSFALSFLALIVLGASDVISVVIRTTLVQIETPDAMRGRVNSVNQLFIGTSNQLGEFESGASAAWLGPVAAAVVGGIGTLIVVVLWIKFFPALFNADRYE